MNKSVQNEQPAVQNTAVCDTPEYLQCAMQAADEGVKPRDIKDYCGCEA